MMSRAVLFVVNIGAGARSVIVNLYEYNNETGFLYRVGMNEVKHKSTYSYIF